MIPEYKYQVKDFSVLTPYFRNYVAQPLLRFLPWGLPANIITIISNMFTFSALALAVTLGPNFAPNFIIIPILILLYLLFDHFDGMQAKRTKTSSALGEYFDHFLDVLNNGTLMTIIFVMFKIDNVVLIASLISLSYITHASVFFEQYKTKWLIFEKFGSFEAVTLVSVILLISIIKPFFSAITSPLIYNFSIFDLIISLAVIAGVFTLIQTLIRTKTIDLKFASFIIGQLIVTVFSAIIFKDNILMILFTISLYSANYIGRLQRAHLAGTQEPIADIGYLIIILSPVLFPDYFKPENITVSTIFYLGLYIILLMSHTIYLLRKFWVWKNPKINS